MSTVFLAGGEFSGRSIVADAILQVNPKHSANITSHPVETGINVSDHIHQNNVVIDIVGEFTNLFNIREQENVVGYINRDQEAWGVLFKIFSQEQPLTIVSRFQVYENCYITSLIPMDELDTGETLRFSLTAEQVRFANLEERAASQVVRQGNLQDNVANKENKGLKTPSGDGSRSRVQETLDSIRRGVTGG